MNGTIAGGCDAEVERIDRCALSVGDSRWDFAVEHAREIDAHWSRRRAANPAMFNGTIFILEKCDIRARVLQGTLLRTEFKSFLYWKDHNYPDQTVRDVFGSALILSVEGHVMLGRQAAGNLNAGLAYLPGGFIDQRDIGADGTVDIASSVAREVGEETGLSPQTFTREPGFLLTRAGAMTSIAVTFRSSRNSDELRAHVAAHIGADPTSELSETVVVRSAADLCGIAMPMYARVLLAHHFSGQ